MRALDVIGSGILACRNIYKPCYRDIYFVAEVLYLTSQPTLPTMKLQALATSVLFASTSFAAVVKRAQFTQGQPIDDKGKGAPILGT
jgi:hypothetical protein